MDSLLYCRRVPVMPWVILKTARRKEKDLETAKRLHRNLKGWEKMFMQSDLNSPAGKDVKINEIIFKYGENPSGDVRTGGL